jgi:hypothetical protein
MLRLRLRFYEVETQASLLNIHIPSINMTTSLQRCFRFVFHIIHIYGAYLLILLNAISVVPLQEIITTCCTVIVGVNVEGDTAALPPLKYNGRTDPDT